MSLDPFFKSTMFGGIVVAGAGVAGMAFAALLAATLPRQATVVAEEPATVLNDLGNLLLAFVMAFFGMSAWQLWRMLRHGMRPGLRNAVAGLGLGVLNFGNMVFYVRAHQTLPESPATVFATMNIGVVLLGTALGVLAFGEPTSPHNRAGIALAVVAIVLIALAGR